MYQVMVVFQVLFGLSIIGLIMIQHGKGADAGAAFGSGASGSVFGAQGSASFLSRATAILALLFFATSLGLAVMIGHRDEGVDIMDIPEVQQEVTDMPVVEGSEEPMKVPSISQQQQQAEQEMPAIVVEQVDMPDATEYSETIEEVIIPETETASEPAAEFVEIIEEVEIPEAAIEEQPATN